MNKEWNGACHGIAISMAIASQDSNLCQYTPKGKATEEYNRPGYFGSLFGKKDELHSILDALVEEGKKSEVTKALPIFFYEGVWC